MHSAARRDRNGLVLGMAARPSQPDSMKDTALAALVSGILLTGALWVAGVASAHLSGHRTPHGHALAELAAFGHLGQPSAAWHAPVGPPELYWTVTVLVVCFLAFVVWGAWRLFHPRPRRWLRGPDIDRGPGRQARSPHRRRSEGAARKRKNPSSVSQGTSGARRGVVPGPLAPY